MITIVKSRYVTMESYYKALTAFHTLHFIPMTHLLWNWKFVPFSAPLFVLCIYNSSSVLFVDLFSFLDSTCKWNHIVFFLLWLILRSLKLFKYLRVVANGKISFFLWLSNMPVGVCISHLLYPFTNPWKWRCFCILARVIML